MMIAFGCAALGYGWVSLTADVLAPSAIPALVLLGVGQSSTIPASRSSWDREARADIRGSVFGVQSFCGGLGILGDLRGSADGSRRGGPGSPFLLLAVPNLLVLGWAWWVKRQTVTRATRPRWRSQGKPPTGRTT